MEPLLGAGLIGKSVGNYVITQVLGSGGMGAVYLAEHPTIGRKVAVKFLAEDAALLPQNYQRFLNEARAIAQLRHPNIVEVYDFGCLEKHYYYVMELLDGCDLRHYLDADERLSPEAAFPLLKQICDGLSAVHAQGVVHRDLKPENIYILNRPAPNVKLFDFGIACITAPNTPRNTLNGQMVGTATHMAPEQITSNLEQIGPRTDIYALGVVMFEMLAGRLPFEGESHLAIIAMHLMEPAPLLTAIEPRMPLGLSSLVDQCLRKNPEERPANVAEVADRFVEAMKQKPAPPSLFSLASPAISSAPDTSRAPPSSSQSIPSVSAAATIKKLLKRIEKEGDLPAFAGAVGQISMRAHADSMATTRELAETIMRDPSLCTKLLRYVNASAYYAQGTKVTTVSRAIMLLGFEKVRSMVLSVRLFQNVKSRKKASELLKLTTTSILSGELARLLAEHARMNAHEEAFLCASFRYLGRQLVLYYLPDVHDEIVSRANTAHIGEARAASTVLGQTYEDIGLEVGKKWGLAETVLAGMIPIPRRVEPPKTDIQRLATLATYSSEILEAMQQPAATRDDSLEFVRRKYVRAFPIEPNKLKGMVIVSTRNFRSRYAKIIDAESPNAGLLDSLRHLGDEGPRISDARSRLPQIAESRSRRSLRPTRPPTMRLALIDARMAQIEHARKDLPTLLQLVVETIVVGFQFERVSLLVAGAKGRSLMVRASSGEGASRLYHLEAPLGSKNADIFALAFSALAEPIFFAVANGSQNLPPWYRTVAGKATTLVLKPIGVENVEAVLLCESSKNRSRFEDEEKPRFDHLCETLIETQAHHVA